MGQNRWAITSTRAGTHAKTGEPFESISYLHRIDYFSFWGNPDEAMTWPRKVDAVGYLRRKLGSKPGAHGHSVVNLTELINGDPQ
jgi:hypothetical protein